MLLLTSEKVPTPLEYQLLKLTSCTEAGAPSCELGECPATPRRVERTFVILLDDEGDDDGE